MFSKFMSLLLAGTVLSSFPVFAASIEVGSSEVIIETGNIFNITERTDLLNWGTLVSENGHIFYMNTGSNPYLNLSGSTVLNNNIMLTNGTGYSVYADPLENQRMTTQVFNMGFMDRINLYKTDASYVVNGAPVIVDSTVMYNSGSILEGSVLMGPNARLDNYGIMRNWLDASGSAVDASGKAYDFNPDFSTTPFSSNTIWFDRRGELHNGIAISSTSADELLLHIFDQESTISTDNIFFKQTGELYSAGIINNKFIGAGDNVEVTLGDGSVAVLSSVVRLINNPFYETDATIGSFGGFTSHLDYVNGTGSLKEVTYIDKESNTRTIQYATDNIMAENNRSDLTTEEMTIGNMSEFSVDMGSKVSINELNLGEESKVDLGSSYYLTDGVIFDDKPDKQAKLSAKIEVQVEHLREVEVEDSETGATHTEVEKYTETENRPLTIIPHRTEVSIGQMTLEKDSTLTLSNMTDLDGIVLSQTDAAGVTTEIAPAINLGDNNTMSVTGGSVNLSGLINVKGSDNMTYFHEARKDNEVEDTMYERRKLSFVSYGNYAGQLFLGGMDGKEYWSGVNSVKRSDYGNDYLGYIKGYLNFITDLKAPTSMTDFDNFDDSVISFGENGTLSLNAYSRDEQISLSSDKTILEDEATVDNEIYIRSVLPVNEEEQAIFMTKTLSMEKENSQIELNGGIVSVKDIKLGDNATITSASGIQNALFADTITFGNNGKYETAEDFSKVVGYVNDKEMNLNVPAMTTILSGDMTFGDDGYFSNNSVFKANKLVMGERATIDVGDNLWVETWVDSDSKINILPMESKGDLNGISNGLFKKDGAENVEVFSNAKNLNTIEDNRRVYNENYLLNGVNVDKIHVQSGGLLMGTFLPDAAKGDIYGNILMSSDTWVHFVGNNIKIYDPISRENGATNTLVWFDLEDSAKYDTLNTIDSDDVLIAGGVLNVHHTITAPTITLDTAGALRVYDNLFVKADVVEYETSAANTTLFLKPRFEKIDSFGIVNLDRIILENGTFNTYHSILARGQNDGSPEGIWMGSNTTLNIYSDVQTSRLIRREDQIEGVTFPIVNTTAVVDKGSLTIDLSADVDTLDLKSGTFVFKNNADGLDDPTQRNIYVTNDVEVGSDMTFWAKGSSDINSGRIVVGNGYGNLIFNGSYIGLTPEALAATEDPGVMNLSSNVFIGDNSILDLRTNDNGSDAIHATGRIDLSGNTRLFVRNLKEKTNYLLMTADSGLSLPASFDVSFRWHGTDIGTPDGKNLWLSIDNITTLKEELENGNVSKNVLKIGSYISDNWDGSYGPWDEIFFATTLDNAVKGINEYMPEGYINAPQTVLRTSANFQNLAIGELDDMRQLSAADNKSGKIRKTYKRPNYYARGRSGGDMYQPYVRSRYREQSGSPTFRSSDRPTYRTDKGGLWAKPFYVSMTQDANKGMAGYDYDAFGLAAGVDRRFGRWTWGLSGLYATGDYETDNSVIKADTDTWGVGLYGSYRPRHSAFFMDLFASYVLNSNEAQHQIKSAKANLKADYDINAISAGLAFGYDVELAKSFYITPKIGFNWTRLSSDEIKEEGEAPLVMRVENPNINSLQLPVEIRLAFPVATRRFELLPELHFRYTHDFGDTDYESKAYVNGTDSVFKLDNVGMPENLFTLGGSLGFTTGPHELSGRYEYDFGDGLNSHLFNVGYKYLF